MHVLQLARKNYIATGLASIIFGLIYFAISSAYFDSDDEMTWDNETPYQHANLHIFSPAGRDILLNFVSTAPNTQLSTPSGEPIEAVYSYPKTRVSHQDKIFGDVYSLNLVPGHNNIHITRPANGRAYKISYAQQYRFFDFIVFFIAFLIPTAVAMFYVFSRALIHGLSLKPKALPWGYIILGLAIALRLGYFWDMGFIQFQHDYHAHIEYIEFIAKEFFIPLPHKAWEFPQQPFYYLVNGSVYSILSSFGIAKNSILMVISGMGTLLSCLSLIFAYRLVRLLSGKPLVQNLTLCFLCFMPSLIYMSTRINNDAWAASLAIISLYYIIVSYRSNFTQKFYSALFFCSLLFLTKISGMVIELVFMIILIAAFIKTPKSMQRPGLAFSLVGFLVLGYTLFRLYYPAAHAFSVVNSGIWPGQDLRPITLNYFFSFHFSDLLAEAQSHIGSSANPAITRSFFTYQYATMLFGEFDYSYWRNQSYWLFFNMQILLAISIIVPLGWLSFMFTRKNFIEKVFLAALAVSLLLLVKFIFTYPSVSNTDFRYHAPVFFILAYCFSLGIATWVERFPQIKTAVTTWACMFVFFNITFIATLISL